MVDDVGNLNDDGESEGVGQEQDGTTESPFNDEGDDSSSPMSFSLLEVILMFVIVCGAFLCCSIICFVCMRAKAQKKGDNSNKLKVYIDSQTHTEMTQSRNGTLDPSSSSGHMVGADGDIETINLQSPQQKENNGKKEDKTRNSDVMYELGNTTKGDIEPIDNKKSVAEKCQEKVLDEIVCGNGATTMG